MKDKEKTKGQLVNELNVLRALSHRVSATLSLDQVVEAALEGVVDCIAPDLALLYLRQGDVLLLQGARSRDSEFRLVIPGMEHVGQCLCGLAAREAKPAYSSNIHTDPLCTLEQCKEAGMHSFAALPLLKGTDVLGVLGVASTAERDFGERSVFLEALAGEVAMGLQNALLYQQVQRHAAELEQQVIGRAQAEKELRKHRLSQAVEQSANTVVITNLEGEIEYANLRFKETTGYTVEEALGQNPRILKSGEHPESYYRELWETITSGGVWRGEFHNKRKDGTLYWEQSSIAPVYDATGQMTHFIAVKEDVTARKKAEEALHLANLIVENSPVVLFRRRAAEGWSVDFVSENVVQFGYTPEELLSGAVPYASIVHPDDLERVAREVQEYSAGGADHFRQEYRIVARDGTVRWTDDRTVVERDAQGRITHYQGIVMDITRRRQAEEKTKAALAEKEVLLKEVYHRVKNNLLSLVYLIDMQTETVETPKALQVLGDLQGRIEAMAMVHERLYQSRDLARIDFGEYLRGLTANLFHAMGNERDITLHVDTADGEHPEALFINVNVAIPCGLIVNELVTNALKYAFPSSLSSLPMEEPALSSSKGTEREEVHVEFRRREGEYVLVVGDNGVGLPPELDWRTTESLGLKLVNIWATYQLGGSLEVDTHPRGGTTFTIRFAGQE